MAANRKVGGQTKLTKELKTVMINLALEGRTNLQIASLIGICEKTVYNWFNVDAELVQAIKDAKSKSDENVERSLLERASGYSHKAVKIHYDSDRGKFVEKEYVEHFPPDPTSMIFWLKNRQPGKWRDKQELDLTKEIIVKIGDDEKDL